MFLKSIKVENFRKFDSFSLSFPSDITVVKGPNEKGKSTILLAVLAGLFYDPKKSNRDIEFLRSWNSDKLYKIELDIENDGADIFIKKDFENKTINLKNEVTKEELSDYKDVSEYLYNIGSLRSLSLFESTACVKHDALTLLTEGKREISSALQSLLASNVENVNPDRIIKKANDLASDILKGIKHASKTPGKIKEIEEKLVDLESKKTEIKSQLEELSKKVDYLSGIKYEYEAIKKDLEIKERQYNINADYFKAVNELDALNNQLEKVDKDFEILEDLEKKKEYLLFHLKSMKIFKDFDIKYFYLQKNLIKEKEIELKNLKNSTIDNNKKRIPYFKYLSLASFFVGIFGLLYKYLFFGFIFSVLFFVIDIFVEKRGSISTKKELTDKIKKAEKELYNARKYVSGILKNSNSKNELDLMDNIEKYNDFCGELSKILSKEEGILRGSSFDEFKKDRKELLKKIGIEEAKITDEQKINMPSSEKQRELELVIEKNKAKLDKLSKEILQVSTVVAQYNVNNEDLVEIEESIEYEKNKKDKLMHKVDVLKGLAENLKEAQGNVIANSKKHIEEYMKKYLPIITNGRYLSLRVENDLSFKIFSEEKGEFILPENHLSRGTIDQFYLIARFAVLDALNKGKKSLVLLDDPFHSFDSVRREKVREILNDLRNKFQIILFTHSSDYDNWGDLMEIN